MIQHGKVSDDEISVTTLKVSNGRFINNNYMLLNHRTGQALLIDPAWEMDKLSMALKAANAQLAGILITHAHTDHIDLAGRLATDHSCPVWISRLEAEESGFTLPTLHTFDEKAWEVAGMLIRPIITPGHTSGSTCYWIGNHVFTGDTLFIEGCGICAGSEAARSMHASIQRLKAILPGDVFIYPGHSYQQPAGLTFERLFHFNIYLLLDNEEKFINFRLRPGQKKSRWMSFS